MTVESILEKKEKKVYSINPDQTVKDALQVLTDKSIGSLIVIDKNEKIAGILSERDILRKMFQTEFNINKVLIHEIMTPKEKLIVGKKSDNIQTLMVIMSRKRIRHIPIVEEDKIVAMVSIGDVIRNLLEISETEKKLLRDYLYLHI